MPHVTGVILGAAAASPIGPSRSSPINHVAARHRIGKWVKDRIQASRRLRRGGSVHQEPGLFQETSHGPFPGDVLMGALAGSSSAVSAKGSIQSSGTSIFASMPACSVRR